MALVDRKTEETCGLPAGGADFSVVLHSESHLL